MGQSSMARWAYLIVITLQPDKAIQTEKLLMKFKSHNQSQLKGFLFLLVAFEWLLSDFTDVRSSKMNKFLACVPYHSSTIKAMQESREERKAGGLHSTN